MKKSILALLAVAAVLAVGFFFKNQFLDKKEAGPTAAVPASGGPGGGGPKAPAAQIEGFIARSSDLAESLTISGTLRPAEEVEIRPEIAGRMVEMRLEEGRQVQKGELLVKLFDGDLQANLEKLRQQKLIAETSLDRLKKLLAASGTSQNEVDLAQNQLNNIVAEQNLISAQLTRTEVRAPFSGRLGMRSVSPGAYVSPTMSLATLYQTSPLKIDFFVPEKHAAQMREGQTIGFEVEGFSQKFTARVAVIEPKIDESTRSMKIRAVVQNAANGLRPGAFAKIDLKVAEGRGIVIPTQALLPGLRDKKVIVSRGGKAEMQVVQTGQRTEDFVEISAGLAAGDTVVTTGLLFVRQGTDLKFKTIAR